MAGGFCLGDLAGFSKRLAHVLCGFMDGCCEAWSLFTEIVLAMDGLGFGFLFFEWSNRMLTLSRKKSEEIFVGDEVRIVVVDIRLFFLIAESASLISDVFCQFFGFIVDRFFVGLFFVAGF